MTDIRRSGQTEHAAERDRIGGGERRPCGQPLASREPQRQVPTRRVADGDHPIQIEGILCGELAQVIRAVGDVLERARPAAALVSDTAILESPGGDAFVGQAIRQRADMSDIVLREPATAVDHDRHGKRPRPCGQAQLPELERAVAVGEAHVRLHGDQSIELLHQQRLLASLPGIAPFLTATLENPGDILGQQKPLMEQAQRGRTVLADVVIEGVVALVKRRARVSGSLPLLLVDRERKVRSQEADSPPRCADRRIAQIPRRVGGDRHLDLRDPDAAPIVPHLVDVGDEDRERRTDLRRMLRDDPLLAPLGTVVHPIGEVQVLGQLDVGQHRELLEDGLERHQRALVQPWIGARRRVYLVDDPALHRHQQGSHRRRRRVGVHQVAPTDVGHRHPTRG